MLTQGKLHDPGLGGRIAITRDNFTRLKGYDEKFEGWGNDDNNFGRRAMDTGLQLVKVPDHMRGSALIHSDEARIENMAPAVRSKSEATLREAHGFRTRAIRKLRQITHTMPAHTSPAPANENGEFGCGTVRINFKEDVMLGPVQPMSASPTEPENPILWSERVAGKGQPESGRAA